MVLVFMIETMRGSYVAGYFVVAGKVAVKHWLFCCSTEFKHLSIAFLCPGQSIVLDP